MVNLTHWTALKNHLSFTGCPKNILKKTYFLVIFYHILRLVVSLTVALKSLFWQNTFFHGKPYTLDSTWKSCFLHRVFKKVSKKTYFFGIILQNFKTNCAPNCNIIIIILERNLFLWYTLHAGHHLKIMFPSQGVQKIS